MKVRLTKNGESEAYVHLNLYVGKRLAGAIIFPATEWEALEEDAGFMVDTGDTVDCELTAVTVKPGETPDLPPRQTGAA